MASLLRVTYVKRYKMEVDLGNLPSAPFDEEFALLPWSRSLLDTHARVLFGSFEHEIDGRVFPCLSDRLGCLQLMRDIARRSGFVPGATWLLTANDEPCGTIQGLCERTGLGSIQNVGVLPSHRGRGIGTALLFRALEGFRTFGLERASLEVTAENERAIQLYWRLGFRRRKTIYKAVTSPGTGFEASPND